MKLGEALALRADLQKRMQQVQKLLLDNATLQEGDSPTIDPAVLLDQYSSLAVEHERAVRRINRANVAAQLVVGGEGMSLLARIAYYRCADVPCPPTTGRASDQNLIRPISK